MSSPFSPLAASALTQAVKYLAGSEGLLEERLRDAAAILGIIRPADLDAELWADLVKARGSIARSCSQGQLQRTAETLVEILVRYMSNQPKL